MAFSAGTNFSTPLKDEEIDFDEEDLVIDEGDLSSFLTEHIEEESKNNISDLPNNISSQLDNKNSDNSDIGVAGLVNAETNDTEPKEEHSENLIDEKTEDIYGQNPAPTQNGSEYFSNIRSEIMQEIKSEDNPDATSAYNHSTYSQDPAQYAKFPHGYQQPPPSHGYSQPPPSHDYAYPPPSHDYGYNQPIDQFAAPHAYDQERSRHGYDQPPMAHQPVPSQGYSQQSYITEPHRYLTTNQAPVSNAPRKQAAPRRRPSVGEEIWISDDGVPQGWKYRVCPGNNKTIVMAPSGKKFDGRKNALAYMKANNYPGEEIFAMDASLSYEGWKEHDCLPNGWKYRKGSTSGLDYLSSEGKVLTSHLAALNHIKANYPDEAVNNFNYFSQTWNKSRPSQPISRPAVVKAEEWRTDESVPSSWRIKNINGKEILLSPYGTQFESRRHAFQALVEANYPDEDKADMFDKLACEGFKANELLPFGWIYQKTEGDINFLSRDGRLITSFRNASEYLVRSREFSGEEIQKFKMFEKLETLTSIQPTTIIQRSQPTPIAKKSHFWNENDQTIPIGWKSRPEGNGVQKIFLSPRGYELKSRRLALKHMVGVGYSEEEIEQMRQFLYYENWMDDKSLPHLWKMKKSGSDVSFVSREGDLLESQSQAFTYIQRNPESYSQDDLLRIQYISSMVKKSSEETRRQIQVQERSRPNVRIQPKPQVVSQVQQLTIKGQSQTRIQTSQGQARLHSSQSQGRSPIQGRSPGMVSILKQSRQNQVKVERIDPKFISDDTVPKGWRYKTEGKLSYFRAPNGTVYRSRRNACQTMITSGQYSNEDIEEMRTCLKYEGWLDSSDIPDGWKIKKKHYATLLMGRGGEFFKSSVEAAKFIQNYIQYFSQDDVDKINVLARINQPKTGRIPNNSEWNENDATVPRGWKTKRRTGRGVCLLDPNGVSFYSRRKALQHLVKNCGNSEEIDSIRDSLKHEGWRNMGNILPQNWLYRKTSSYCYWFISSEGELFESKGKAIEHLKKSGNFSDENQTMIEDFRDPSTISVSRPSAGKSHRREPVLILNPDETWISGDDTLPNGWKSKEVRVGSNKPFKMLLSKSGNKFRSRRTALNFMLTHNFPEAEVEAIRKSLQHDGWKSDPLLPEHWVYRNVKQPTYCNEEGGLLISHTVAIGFLQESAKHSTEDVNNLIKFIDKTGGRLPSKSELRPFDLNRELKPFDSTSTFKRILESAVNKDELFITLEGLGWKEHLYLPTGWFYRERKETDKCINIVSKEGKLFQSYKSAVLFMRSTNLYTSEEIQKFYLFPDGNAMHAQTRENRTGDGIVEQKKILATDDDWVENDDTVPNGWKSKIIDSSGRKCFLTRDRQVMMSRRGALKMLIKAGVSEEEVEEMRSLLNHDGWQECSLLPEGWRFKKRGVANLFMNRNGDLMKLIKDVLEYMRNDEKYTSSHEEDFRKFVAQNLAKKGRKYSEFDLSNYSMSSVDSISLNNSSCSNLRKLYLKGDEEESLEKIRFDLMAKGWKVNEYLPQKWLFRERTVKSPHMKLLSEEGIRFSSNKSVISFMEMNEKYSEKDMDVFKLFPNGKMQHVSRELKPLDSTSSLKQILESAVNKDELMQILEGMGWKEHLYLPTGWLYRERVETDKCIHIISKEGKLFQSYKAAVLFMRSTNLYTPEDIQSFYLFPDGDSMLAKKRKNRTGNGIEEEKKILASDDDWVENDTVPKGWKSKVDANGRECLLSPNGQVIMSRRGALKTLINTGASEVEVEEMRSLLSHDDWEQFSLLPEGWRFKRRNLHNFYMTKNGELLKTHKDALEYMRKDESYTSSTEEDFRKFMDENLPKKGSKGSKMDLSNTSFSSDLSISSLSLNNTYDGRISSVSLLRKLFFEGDEESAKNIRSDLMKKGWKENEYLPQKWLFRERTETSPHLKIVSEEGIKFSSYKSVVSYMASNGKYSENDVQLFRKFPHGKHQQIKKEVLEQEMSTEVKEEIKASVDENTIAMEIADIAIKEESSPERSKKDNGNLKKFTPKQYAKILKENNDEELQEFKKYYFGKGWVEDVALLPPMWLFRQKPGFTSFHFLSSKGELLLSTKEANKYLANIKFDHFIDAKKLKERVNNKKVKAEITEVKEESNDGDDSQIDIKENYDLVEKLEEIKSESGIKVKEADVKIPSGITLKRVSVTGKENTKSEQVVLPRPVEICRKPNEKFVNKDAAEIVEKFKTVNSGLKISFSSVKK